ncbi:MAG: hypothetical protein Q7U28_08105 [Aquabacterium sp.]|nr:hypothetical protein [Aquabacterium sp.]
MQTSVDQQQAISPRVALLAAQQSATLSHYSQEQQDAALRLFKVAYQHLGTGGGNTCAKLLLGLYNGTRFPFDLTDLRRLDEDNLNAAITVLHMDAAHTWCEIHVLLDAICDLNIRGKSTGSTLELWAHDLRLKGRCNKEAIPELKARAV